MNEKRGVGTKNGKAGNGKTKKEEKKRMLQSIKGIRSAVFLIQKVVELLIGSSKNSCRCALWYTDGKVKRKWRPERPKKKKERKSS